MAGSERQREIRRRRHRKKKMKVVLRKVSKASVSEKQHIATKLRELTPGAPAIIERLALEERA
ncbi:MAG: DUF6800 family protein [Pirellulaceae bacterium]|nr:hypothetical protein [Planctomycetales bacterium]